MGKAIQWDLGPDCLYPASCYTTSKLDGAVKLRIDGERLTLNKKNPSFEPVSIFTRFKQTVEEGPEKIALGKT
jgi:hypothetical protein